VPSHSLPSDDFSRRKISKAPGGVQLNITGRMSLVCEVARGGT